MHEAVPTPFNLCGSLGGGSLRPGKGGSIRGENVWQGWADYTWWYSIYSTSHVQQWVVCLAKGMVFNLVKTRLMRDA